MVRSHLPYCSLSLWILSKLCCKILKDYCMLVIQYSKLFAQGKIITRGNAECNNSFRGQIILSIEWPTYNNAFITLKVYIYALKCKKYGLIPNCHLLMQLVQINLCYIKIIHNPNLLLVWSYSTHLSGSNNTKIIFLAHI